MVINYIVGLSILCVFIWCLLFMFSVSKQKHRNNSRRLKLKYSNNVNTQNVNDSINGVKKRTSIIVKYIVWTCPRYLYHLLR